MTKKKIAVIGLKGLPAFGGAAAVGENIIDQLNDRYDFTVYATASHAQRGVVYHAAQQIIFNVFPIKKINILYYYIASAFHAVFKGDFDLVHLHHTDGAFILFILRLRYPVISTSHGLPYKIAKWNKITYPYFKINEWIQIALSSRVTVVAKSLLGHYQRLRKDVVYIPNGITIPVDQQASAGEDYILFAAGRIISIKGLHILIDALDLLNYKGRLIVLGDIDQMPAYRQLILEKCVSLNVEFKGLIKDREVLNTYIRNSKLFIFPSTREAMSMMLLEVASLRVPVICSDIVENTDVFEQDEMVFFNSGDHADLARKLTFALDNPDALKQYTAKAYESLLKNYQWSSIATQYATLYDALTHG